jgi:luciferase family oxidoreductase group 1
VNRRHPNRHPTPQMPFSPSLENTPLSVLDLAFVREGGSPAESFRNMLALARHTEKLGYKRFWIAEHHNMPSVASSATAVLIGHVACSTSKIRVGSGGIMLPNHAPLVVAEQFGTLSTLYPNRIDLGLGRAPGTDPQTARALRRNLGAESADTFPQDVLELMSYLHPSQQGQAVHALPGAGVNVPIWILGSSLFSAHLAARLGLPYAFASHFAPQYLVRALEVYREEFQPSADLARPYAMIALNVIAASTDEEAARRFSSLQQAFLNIQRGTRRPLQPPVHSMDDLWSDFEQLGVESFLSGSVVGSPENIRRGLEAFLGMTNADEIMVSAPMYDHEARIESFQIVMEVSRTSERESSRTIA